jgi:hypothetical protein
MNQRCVIDVYAVRKLKISFANPEPHACHDMRNIAHNHHQTDELDAAEQPFEPFIQPSE